MAVAAGAAGVAGVADGDAPGAAPVADPGLVAAERHLRRLLGTGQQVTRGQKIAEMGSTDTDRVQLHFEIRRLGRPVDPAKLLPSR